MNRWSHDYTQSPVFPEVGSLGSKLQPLKHMAGLSSMPGPYPKMILGGLSQVTWKYKLRRNPIWITGTLLSLGNSRDSEITAQEPGTKVNQILYLHNTLKLTYFYPEISASNNISNHRFDVLVIPFLIHINKDD